MNKVTMVAMVACLGLVAGCAMADKPCGTNENQGVVWALNVGGVDLVGSDGVQYEADTLAPGGDAGDTGMIWPIKGSQDAQLLSTYREGIRRLVHPIANGIYDVTLKFAEPDETGTPRQFHVSLEGKQVIPALDVRAWRDGKAKSGLEHTATQVAVTDGELEVEFTPVTGEPILNALVVRGAYPAREDYQLVWSDEFDVDGAPDPQRWNYDIWPARKVNDEDQVYTDRPRNVRVEDGLLIIEAHKEDYDNGKYTSGRIHGANKGSFLYGRAEIRARLPGGRGTWSAIWMMPDDFFRYATLCDGGDPHGNDACDAWPNSGEIDIMEYVGYDPNRVHATVHTKAYYWKNWEQRKASIDGRDVEEAFHVYSIEWTPDDIRMFLDDTPYFHYANEGDGWQSWPFDHAFHIILNLAIGGHWGRAGGPIDDSIFPVRMEVDYVRVFAPSTTHP